MGDVLITTNYFRTGKRRVDKGRCVGSTMEEVLGTTNLMRLVDRLRAEMTQAYYDDNDDRMKMRRPSIKVSLKDTYGGWFGARLDLNITLTQLRSIVEQHDAHIADARVWMGEPHYQYKVWKATWSDSIDITCSFEFNDLRIKGDDGRFIGYKNADGEVVLWNHGDDE